MSLWPGEGERALGLPSSDRVLGEGREKAVAKLRRDERQALWERIILWLSAGQGARIEVVSADTLRYHGAEVLAAIESGPPPKEKP